MKTTFNTAMGLLLMVGTIQCCAQQTNLVQNLNINLYGVKQGRTTTNGNSVSTGTDVVRINTRNVVQALAESTGIPFAAGSRLVLVTPIDGAPPAIEVREQGYEPVDVSSYFELQPMSDSVQDVYRNLQFSSIIIFNASL
jgi:hypothetical protein